MALGPDGLITVVGDIDTITDGTASGTLTVELSSKLVLGTKVYLPIERQVALDPTDGTFSVKLPPTAGTGITYRFTLSAHSFVEGQRERYTETFDATLDAADADTNGVIQYRALTPVAAPGVPQTFLTRSVADLRYLLKADAENLVTAPELAQALVGLQGGSVDLSAYATTQALTSGLNGRVPEADFVERVQDAVAALLAAGTGVTVAYDDTAGKLTLTSAGGGGGGSTDPEVVRDTIGVALAGVGLVSVAMNDAADTITITTTATANSTDAQLRDRGTHTGQQAISTVTGLQAALDLKAATTDLAGKVNEADFVERVQDAVAALLAAGTGVTVTYDDALGRLTLASSAAGGATDPEVVRDTIGVALAGAGLVSVAVNDAADTITITTTATANSTDAQLRDRATHTGNALPPTTLLWAAARPDDMAVGAITYNAAGAPTSHNVTWPDGASGTYTGTTNPTFPGSIDSYTITRVLGGSTTTYTQPAVTRDGTSGLVTSRPAITVA